MEKGLEILEYLSEQRDSKSLPQIADGVGRSKNEIFRMMIVLEESGYVDRREADNFVLSDKLYQLGLRRPANKRLTDIALPLMDEFCAQVPYCCYLVVPSEEQSVVLAKAESATSLGLSVTIGHRVRLDQSAEGMCLLAFMPDPRFQQIAESFELPAQAMKALKADMIQIQSERCIVRPSDIIAGVQHIAAPVYHGIGDNMIAALAVPYFELKKQRVSLQQVTEQLKKLSERVNAAMSGR